MPTLNMKARSIRLLILDVDGILTSGIIYYGPEGSEVKGFHTQDGLGVKILKQVGIVVAVISGRTSESVSRRLAELPIEHVYLGYANKLKAYEDLKQKLMVTDDVIAYMGD